MKTVLRIMLLLTPLAFGGGCTASVLWDDTSLDAWNEPADNSGLRLFQVERRKDLLVVYEEYSERKDTIRTRAYLLNRNQGRLEQRLRPRFVRTSFMRGLPAVPVLASATNMPTNLPQTLYAIGGTNSDNFTVYCGGQKVSSHELPVYNDGKGRLERIAMTPIAATADLTIIGGFIGYFCLEALAESHSSFSFPR